ncbi:MAG: insulinase family protein [Acidobacteria bacterium]|nr:insulinase family protein [Acidobacteriota bacterium]MCG3191632.1 putative zinc protease [Thermoanaerobaculia bacterium]MCK6683843.1 insulinase family protein [Thermoanaerobaculia bacterium]
MITERLDNGLTAWLDPMRDVRSVALGFYVSAGSVSEAATERGSTHFLEHLLFRRSARRTGLEIARAIDRLGGDCDAYTAKETVAFHARSTVESFDAAVDLLFDLVKAPVFSQEDIEMERGVILEEMAEARDIPEDLLNEAFAKNVWNGHPLSEPILGTEESVKALDSPALVSRFEKLFVPARMAFVASGAIDPPKLLRHLGKLRFRRPRGGNQEPNGEPQKDLPKPKVRTASFFIEKPELSQTHVLAGAEAFPHTHRAVPAAWLLSTILGGGVSSRLWRNVRDKRGLAYHVGSTLALFRQTGLIQIEAATAPEKLRKLIKTLGTVLRHVRESGVTKHELKHAKDQVRAEVELSLESTVSRREAAARDWLYRGRPYEVDELLSDIDAVDMAAIESSIAKLFGGAFSLGITGPQLPGPPVEVLAGELSA